ncbi:ATP-binding protein [Sandaracinus amylolyticus]|uniref:ATP-binding protein n=1 Tax=Sandaracinus amylolyticus TaxID=927083 RepID=UPI001F37E1D3|nr:ATP-binding protein [Sandaracinus amylolyticus]
MSVVLDWSLIDDLRRAIARGRALPEVFGDVALGAAFELACACEAGDAALRDAVTRWSIASGVLRSSVRALAGHASPVPDPFGVPTSEIRPAPRDGRDMDDHLWTEHRERFHRSLVHLAGLPARTARAVGGAYAEMADNIISHASSDGSPTRSLVGFRVSSTEFEFAVADTGRGIRASLHERPEHRRLINHVDALDAAVRGGATRRAHAAGGGFNDLHIALADLNAVLRFRTGDAALTLDGRGADRIAARSASPMMDGFQLSVVCRC